MAFVIANRVQETTTTTGTGTVTLAGAVAGFQSFAAVGNANTTYYTITSGTDWEVGIGTYTSSGTTLARTTILSSSIGGGAITLAGTSTVFSSYPTERAVMTDVAQTISNKKLQSFNETLTAATPSAGTVTLDLSTANVFTVTLTTASTALAFSNLPASGVSFSITLIVKQDATGGRLLTYPASCKFTDSVSPVLATTGLRTDVITFFTVDGGTTFFGGQALANLSP